MNEAFFQIEDFERAARELLPRVNFEYFAGGADDEVTIALNREALARLSLLPRVLCDTGQSSTRLELLGIPLSSPILIAPTAFHLLAHADGELATTRAARAFGSLHIVSTTASTPMETIAEAWAGSDQKGLWFQLSVQKDEKVTRDLVTRAEHAGYRAIVVSVDAPVYGKRISSLRNRFQPPPGVRPANFAPCEGDPFTYPERLTWDDIERLRDWTSLPILLKGILDPRDAELAARRNYAGIIVSNHGGRQLDGAPATIRMLPDIARAVGNELPLIVDGGFRRGTDVLKALALGAKAVALGRPILWGLAARGESGVRAVLEIVHDELSRAMRLCGVATLEDADPTLILSGA